MCPFHNVSFKICGQIYIIFRLRVSSLFKEIRKKQTGITIITNIFVYFVVRIKTDKH
jgi:hypothetical protein